MQVNIRNSVILFFIILIGFFVMQYQSNCNDQEYTYLRNVTTALGISITYYIIMTYVVNKKLTEKINTVSFDDNI